MCVYVITVAYILTRGSLAKQVVSSLKSFSQCRIHIKKIEHPQRRCVDGGRHPSPARDVPCNVAHPRYGRNDGRLWRLLRRGLTGGVPCFGRLSRTRAQRISIQLGCDSSYIGAIRIKVSAIRIGTTGRMRH